MRRERPPYRSVKRRPPELEERPEQETFKPRLHRELRTVLREVGAPEDRPFTPDPFQVEALARLKKGDVVVSAPTGAGKTYIAVEAMAGILARGGRTWYASPLKALSNAKFLEFGQRFGSENVGLLTGDHKVNPDAPVIVGTTEILRNQLYDAMSRGEDLAADLVVMDEAHYLGDPDRGVVWEEVVIYLPPRIRLLLLSATVANAVEIAKWLIHTRNQKAWAVVSHERPVPLYPLFLFPDGELGNLTRGHTLNPRIRHFLRQGSAPGAPAGRRGQPAFARILAVLDLADLLPAIFFLKSRADCDLALPKAHGRFSYLSPERRARLNQRLDELLEKYPFLRIHPQIKYLRAAGLAAHHAGQLPHWKLVIEQLMQEGLLTAIFSTSTVAAGVNFPARTVVLSQSDRFNGHEFVDLTATELLQMTGRAGRRGMDRIGFALVVPGPYQNPVLIQALFNAEPDPVLSQIQVNFSMTLNLLLSHRPAQVKTLLDLSLASFQQAASPQAGEIAGLVEELDGLLAGGLCQDAQHALVLNREARRLAAESARLERSRPRVSWEAALESGLTPGRLFEVYGGLRFCAFELAERHGRSGVLAAKLQEDVGLKKGQVRRKWVQLGRISGLFATVLDMGPETDPPEALRSIRAAARRDHDRLDLADFLAHGRDTLLDRLDRRIETLRVELDRLPCRGCPLEATCRQDPGGRIGSRLAKLDILEAESRASGRLLWSSFLRHLAFLKAEGFVDQEDRLTEDGLWASQLRLDHPLLFAAGIRAGAWPEGDPALLAAVVAPFVADRETEVLDQSLKAPPRLAAAWLKIEAALTPLAQRLQAQGFLTPAPSLRPALAIHHWAVTNEWEAAVRLYGQDPGDMAMLVFRAADHLRQLAGLARTHPKLAPTAREAMDLILKEPVLFPIE
ncbi:MAG: DEAD/DEAH box helicase [Thermodesulfobacteriota bacterium]